MGDRFRLVFSGEVVNGLPVEVVRRRLGDRLRISEEKLDALFAGRRIVVKRSLTFDEATRHVAQFERLGARMSIEALPAESAPSVAASVAPAAPLQPMVHPTKRATADPIQARRRTRLRAAVVSVALVAAGVVLWGRGGAPLLPEVTDERLQAHALSPEAQAVFRAHYWPSGGHKAFAAGPRGAFGHVAGASSEQEAVQRALALCEARTDGNGRGRCALVHLTRRWATPPS